MSKESIVAVIIKLVMAHGHVEGRKEQLLREGALFIHNVNRFSKCCLNAHRLLEVCCLRLIVFLSLFAYVFVMEVTKK